MNAFYESAETVWLGEHRAHTNGSGQRLAQSILIHREQNNRDARHYALQHGRRFDSVHPWHQQIQYDQVRLQFLCLLDGINAVRSFLPGKLLSRTAAFLALAVVALGLGGLANQELKQLLDVDPATRLQL